MHRGAPWQAWTFRQAAAAALKLSSPIDPEHVIARAFDTSSMQILQLICAHGYLRRDSVDMKELMEFRFRRQRIEQVEYYCMELEQFFQRIDEFDS